jgi:hypothetical protein
MNQTVWAARAGMKISSNDSNHKTIRKWPNVTSFYCQAKLKENYGQQQKY